MMDRRIYHPRADVDAQLANDKYAEAVPQQRQRNDRQAKHHPLPGPAQNHLAGHQAGDELNQG